MITAATRESTAAASASGSSRGTVRTRNGASGKAYHFAEPSVTAEAAAVRPWNPPVSATTVSRPGPAAKRQPQGVLVRLGAAAHEERAVEPVGGEVHERFAGGGAFGARDRGGLEEDPRRDLVQAFEDGRMAVAEPRDRVAAVEVDQLPSVRRLQHDAFARDHFQRQLGVDGEQRRGFCGHVRYSQAGWGP